MMRRLPLLLGLLLLAPTPAVAAGKVLLVARDLEKKPIPGLCFSYAGVSSAKTNAAGATEIPVPAALRVGQNIELSLLPCSPRTEDWFLVGSLINVPDPAEPAHVVLMSRRVFRKIANEVSSPKAITAGRSETQVAEDPKKALVDAAAKYGLTKAQIETALASFTETKDVNDRGIALYLQGQYSQAEKILEGPAEKEERDLVEKLRYLGLAQYAQGKYQAAAESFRKAVALRDEDVVLLTWLGRAHDELAHWTEAESLMRRALAIDEKKYGLEHPSVAIRLNNLASLLAETNQFSEAEPLMRRALAIDEKGYGPEHTEVATDLNNLATLLLTTNRLAEAEPLMLRALAIDQKRYGPKHPDVARDLNNLAQLFEATNRLAEAEPFLRRALSIDEQSYGPEHPYMARGLNNLALLLNGTNHLAEAELLMRRALEIAERSYGSSGHPDVARNLNNLAQLLKVTNRLAEAEPLMLRALSIDEKSYGPEHPDVARDLNNLALLLKATNRLAEAEPLLRRALSIDEKSYGSEHPDLARDLNNLAELLKATRRPAEAEPLLQRSLAILFDFGRRTGYEHPHLQGTIANYSALLRVLGKSDAEIQDAINGLRANPV